MNTDTIPDSILLGSWTDPDTLDHPERSLRRRAPYDSHELGGVPRLDRLSTLLPGRKPSTGGGVVVVSVPDLYLFASVLVALRLVITLIPRPLQNEFFSGSCYIRRSPGLF